MKRILAVLVFYSPVFAMNDDTRLDNVETRLTSVENVVAKHDTQLREIRNLLKDDISPEETDPMSYYDILIKLGNRVSVIEGDITEHNTELTDIQEDIISINNHLTDHDNRLKATDEHLVTVDTRLNTIDGHLTTVDTRLNTIDEHLVTVDTRLNTIDEHLTTVDDRLNTVDNRLNNAEDNISEIQNILNDKPNPEDPANPIPGLVSKVRNFSSSIQDMSSVVSTSSKTVSDLYIDMFNMKTDLATIETKFTEQLNTFWEAFVDKKFQAYMEEKKIVLDIITACKINGDPTPEYIMETAEQLQECDLKTRRETLSEILTKLTLFERLLDGDKLESLQNYLDDTNVPEPIIKEIGELLSDAIVDRDCVKVTGATKAFTRTTDLKRGLPHEGWMNPDYDYFAYKKYPYVKALINQENAERKAQNEQNERDNALAIAQYKAAIKAAERMTFPTQNFTDLVTDYNRLLTHHDI